MISGLDGDLLGLDTLAFRQAQPQHAAFVACVDLIRFDTCRQGNAAGEGPDAALAQVKARALFIFFLPGLTLDRQGIVGEGDLQVFRIDAGQGSR